MAPLTPKKVSVKMEPKHISVDGAGFMCKQPKLFSYDIVDLVLVC